MRKKNMEELLGKVSDKMMVLKNDAMEEKFPVSLINIDCWEWPQGVGLYGLYQYYDKTKDANALQFLVDWFHNRLQEGISERNINTTAPMLTLTYLYEISKDETYLNHIKSWAEWIMDDNGLLKTKDDCFQHMITGDPNDGEILIDTIFMAVLFLGRAGKILDKKEYIDEANYQILNHIKYLYNKEEGLFFHGWNFNYNHNYGKVMWGRGNSWYTIGIMEYLEQATIDATLERHFLSVYRYQVEALKKYQDKETGLWHTVINNPETYVETSASAAFLAGIMKGVRLGFIPKEEFYPVIERGVKSILQLIAQDGTVDGVSYGTPIGHDEAFYNGIAICPMTYGQALMILMLQELLAPYWDGLV